jgi:hypothetical protein
MFGVWLEKCNLVGWKLIPTLCILRRMSRTLSWMSNKITANRLRPNPRPRPELRVNALVGAAEIATTFWSKKGGKSVWSLVVVAVGCWCGGRSRSTLCAKLCHEIGISTCKICKNSRILHHIQYVLLEPYILDLLGHARSNTAAFIDYSKTINDCIDHHPSP